MFRSPLRAFREESATRLDRALSARDRTARYNRDLLGVARPRNRRSPFLADDLLIVGDHREAASRHLPKHLARRLSPSTKRLERKRGFSGPLTTWFDSERGLLADHPLWARPLLELPELSPERVEVALGAIGAAGLSRRCSVFYALAQWLETNRHAASAAA
jgi:hypothetical protein